MYLHGVGSGHGLLGFAGVQIGGWDHEALKEVGWNMGEALA